MCLYVCARVPLSLCIYQWTKIKDGGVRNIETRENVVIATERNANTTKKSTRVQNEWHTRCVSIDIYIYDDPISQNDIQTLSIIIEIFKHVSEKLLPTNIWTNVTFCRISAHTHSHILSIWKQEKNLLQWWLGYKCYHNLFLDLSFGMHDSFSCDRSIKLWILY